MRKIKPLTKAQYQENFAKIFSVVAQILVAAFLLLHLFFQYSKRKFLFILSYIHQSNLRHIFSRQSK